MASGRPVIAYGSGGALETVVPGVSGMLFNEQSVEALIDAVRDFEDNESTFRPDVLRAHAGQFSLRNFKSGMQAIVDEELLARKSVSQRNERSTAIIQRIFDNQFPVP